MPKPSPKFIPALKFAWLTPLYDLIMQLTMRELTIKRRLVEQMSIERGHRVLDIGCGTATLTIMIKKTYPDAEVVGLDIDPEILDIARSKVAEAGVEIKLDKGRLLNCRTRTGRLTGSFPAWSSITSSMRTRSARSERYYASSAREENCILPISESRIIPSCI